MGIMENTMETTVFAHARRWSVQEHQKMVQETGFLVVQGAAR